MTVSPGSRAFVLELFGGLEGVTARAMMSGLTLYCEGRIFAILSSQDRIYIKASGDLAKAMAAEGSEQFAAEMTAGKISRMGYWTLPDMAIDDPDAACAWARRSLAANHPDFS